MTCARFKYRVPAFRNVPVITQMPASAAAAPTRRNASRTRRAANSVT